MRQATEFGNRTAVTGFTNEGASQRIGKFTELPALIEQLGADAAAILGGAGLPSDGLESADGRVSYTRFGRLLRRAADTTDCAHLGLLVGRMWHLSDLGLVGELMRHSPTVGHALRMLTTHQHLNSDGGLAFVIDRGRSVDVGYAIYESGFEASDVMYDIQMAARVNFLRQLCGPDWLPSQVLLTRSRPLDDRHYSNLFMVRPCFGSEICALRFPAQWLSRPVPGADAGRLRMAQEQVRHASRPDLLHQVRCALRRLLLQDQHSGDQVAQMLAMHRRTLNRRLKARGTTFQEVLDDVRFGVARELLSMSEISLDDVAATLGYAGVSSFLRTFCRWTGTTPGRWRRTTAAASPRDRGQPLPASLKVRPQALERAVL